MKLGNQNIGRSGFTPIVVHMTLASLKSLTEFNSKALFSSRKANRSGFTLIELLVVMGIVMVLFGLTSINLIRPQQKATLDSIKNALLSDLRAQQLNAMTGKNDTSYGIFFQSNSYVLFEGSSFNAVDSRNITVSTLPLTLATTFQNATLVFAKRTGEVANFITNSNQITLTDGSQTAHITLNPYGIPTLP